MLNEPACSMKVNSFRSPFSNQHFSVENSQSFLNLSNIQGITTSHLTQQAGIAASANYSKALGVNHTILPEYGIGPDNRFLPSSTNGHSYYGHPMMNLTYPTVYGPLDTNYSVAVPQPFPHVEAASSANYYSTLFPHESVRVPSQYYGTADHTKYPCIGGLSSSSTATPNEGHQVVTDFAQSAGVFGQPTYAMRSAETVYMTQISSNLDARGSDASEDREDHRVFQGGVNNRLERGNLSLYQQEVSNGNPVNHLDAHNTSGVDLLVTNLDYNISTKEWRKILLTNLQAIVKTVHSVVLQTQADGSTSAIVRVGSVEDARLAISQFHRKKIGYKRIQMNILPSTPVGGLKGPKMEVVSLLRSVNGNVLPVCKLIDLYEKRFRRSISISDLYKMRDVLEIKDQPGAKGGRVVYLNPRAMRLDSIETAPNAEPVVCHRHCLEGSTEYLHAMDGAMLPSVRIPLGLFRQQLLTILLDHGGSMALSSFPACYQAEFGDFVTGFSQFQSNGSVNHLRSLEHTETKVDAVGEDHIKTSTSLTESSNNLVNSSYSESETSTKPKSNPENRLDYESAVPLEHLITCIPCVRVHTEANGVRRIVYSPDQSPATTFPNGPTGQRHSTLGRQPIDLLGASYSACIPSTIGVHPACSPVNTAGILQDQLHQFSREVVDLLKHQPECQILLSKFIPSYHHHFGKQCRVADYGYSKLHELIEALPNVVHVMGTGHTRLLTLSHRVQVRRFTNELIKVLKSQSTKSCRLADYGSLFKRIYRKDFRIRDYGVCYLTDMLQEVPDNAVETSKVGSEYHISLPKRVQTIEEKERTELFAIEVADLLSHTPRCRLLFNKFIPSYHHHFSRQCRVADYGFTKLVDLLEAVPRVVRIVEDNGEKYVTLVQQRHLQIVADQLLTMLEAAPSKRILLNELLNEYLRHQGYALNLEDFGVQTVQELVSKLPKLIRIEAVSVEHATTNDSVMEHVGESAKFSSLTSATSTDSIVPTAPNEETEPENTSAEADEKAHVLEFVSLADRTHVKHLAHKVLLVLFEVPAGVLSVSSFSERFRCTFRDEPNIRLIREELGEIVEIRGSASWNSDEGVSTRRDLWNDNVSVGPRTTDRLLSSSSERLNLDTTKSTSSVAAESSAVETTATEHTDVSAVPSACDFDASLSIIALKPLILFARELRELLRQNQGKISLAQVCTAYQRRFGVPLRPQRYNYPSLASLLQAVDFVAVMRGRGVRSILVLCQDFLGKLAHRVAYSNKPLLEPETDSNPSEAVAFQGITDARGEVMRKKLEPPPNCFAHHFHKIDPFGHNRVTSDGFAFGVSRGNFQPDVCLPKSHVVPMVPGCANVGDLRLGDISCMPAASQASSYTFMTNSSTAPNQFIYPQAHQPQHASVSQSNYLNGPSYTAPMALTPHDALSYLQPATDFASTGHSLPPTCLTRSTGSYLPVSGSTPASQGGSITMLPSISTFQPNRCGIGSGRELSNGETSHQNPWLSDPSLNPFQMNLGHTATIQRAGHHAQCPTQVPSISGFCQGFPQNFGTHQMSLGANPVLLNDKVNYFSSDQLFNADENHRFPNNGQYNLSPNGHQQLDSLVERLTYGELATSCNGNFGEVKARKNTRYTQPMMSISTPNPDGGNISQSSQPKRQMYYSGLGAGVTDYHGTSQYDATFMHTLSTNPSGPLSYWTGISSNVCGASMTLSPPQYSVCSTTLQSTSNPKVFVGETTPLSYHDEKDIESGSHESLQYGSNAAISCEQINKTQSEPSRPFGGRTPIQQLLVTMSSQTSSSMGSTKRCVIDVNTPGQTAAAAAASVTGNKADLLCTDVHSESDAYVFDQCVNKTTYFTAGTMNTSLVENTSLHAPGENSGTIGHVTPNTKEPIGAPHFSSTANYLDSIEHQPAEPITNPSYAVSLKSEESAGSFNIDGLLAELRMEERKHQQQEKEQIQHPQGSQTVCTENVSPINQKTSVLLDSFNYL